MQFIGIDLHTNRFTCSYRDAQPCADPKKNRRLQTFTLDRIGLAQFYGTLTPETHVLVEATIPTFTFVRLIEPFVKEVIVANTYELKQISMARNNTDKIDADILCRVLKMQVLSGEQTISPVTVPPEQIQELRSLFATWRSLQKQVTQNKNRIHSLLKEQLYGYTQVEIFHKRGREEIRRLENQTPLSFQINTLLEVIEFLEAKREAVKEEILIAAEPYMREIDILTSMKGISVFIAIAIMADIIDVARFKNSKAFASYLRSAPRVSNSNTSVSVRGTNKKGRKLSSALLTQSLNHVLAASERLHRWYTKLCEYKKPGLVRTGLRRKVFAEIFQMLKKEEYHYARDPEKHGAKMAAYRKLLEKHKKLTEAA